MCLNLGRMFWFGRRGCLGLHLRRARSRCHHAGGCGQFGCRCRGRWHHAIGRPILHDGPLRCWGWRRGRLGVLDGEHGRLENVRFDGDGNLAQLCHAFLGWIIWFFNHNTLLFNWLCPVLFEDTLHGPLLARSGKRLGKNTTGSPLASTVLLRQGPNSRPLTSLSPFGNR